MRRVRLAAVLLLLACRSGGSAPVADAAPLRPAPDGAAAALPEVQAAAAAPVAAPPAVARCQGASLLQTEIRGSLAESVIRALAAQGLGDDANEVAAHLGRVLMWDLDLRKDILPGDRLRAFWRREASELQITSLRYESRQLGKTIVAHRFTGPGDQQPSYWDDTGLEVPRRLKASPLERYDQITALLKDRPTHKGMDFKTPIGTEVLAPRAGLATRTDWKRKGNGNCLEVRYDDGTIAKFLHLSKVVVHPPARVKALQLIALTGNTGHSTAPHLHYQLNRGERILDPVTYHGTLRRQLKGSELAAFTKEMKAFEEACAGVAAR
jgi:murein DD-endopeptidase